MICRKINKSEYKKLTDIHFFTFKDFFLTSLGKRLLNTYYKACLRSKESISVCAMNNKDQMVGFCIGCIQSKGYHKRLLKQNLFQFIVQGFIILLSKPNALFRLANNLDKNKNKKDDGNYAELLSIAVLPEIKGEGIGKKMIKMFEEEALINGCKKIALTTDFNKNDNVIEFYRKTGYKVFYEFTSYPNRKMYKLIKDLNEK